MNRTGTVETPALPVVKYVELTLSTIAPFWIIYFINLLRRPFFHLNLRILLVNFSISLVLVVLSRIPIILTPDLNMPPNLNLVIHVVHETGLYAIIDWFLNGTCAVIVVLNVSSHVYENYFHALMMVFTILVILNCFGVVVLLAVYRYNKKRWRVDLQKNLTHRYQIMENIKTAKLLLTAAFIDVVISFYYYAIVYVRIQKRFLPDWEINILGQIFDLSCSILALLIPFLSHPRLRLIVKKQCYFKSRARVDRRIVEGSQPRDAAELESNVYFSQLTTSWDRAVRR
ncbi:hypothetical protein L596_013977 [Steinernema carpocapsae]|uniref:G-protein coupled receptors family 1 profile domain-containing protein n=1 Tax=Steinernema carpocapsae TaxID=34508 RepID=A0A4U5NBP5_STECR|nr:hypothetical protein L596_013977 [Steinernema carpocapsae]